MAYSSIDQARADPTTTTSHNLTLGRTPSPHLDNTHSTPPSLSNNGYTGVGVEDEDVPQPEHAESKVSRFLSSLTSSSRHSYDLIEEDDYENIEQATPTLERHPQSAMATTAQTPSDPANKHVPIRTASISRHLPLNHPVPDLQSLQGAYVKNVERLEESAERLSMKSNLQEELQRIKNEQKQRERAASGSSYAGSIGSVPRRHVSTRSISNSIVDVNATARSGGYSPAGYMTSPVGSLRSPQNTTASGKRQSKSSRLSLPLPEPELEGRPLDSDLTVPQSPEMPDLDPRPVRPPSVDSLAERPTTSGSGDTYQQARSLFTDFDGVHFAEERHARASRRISLARPPRARDSRAFKEPQPGEEMVYYPAPVPVMLNLPMRLSKFNWSEQEKKRLQALADIPDDSRRSAAWLANEENIPTQNNRQTRLPPQLRASAFFDHRGMSQDVKLKDGSAVATLDSILDAAAHAPVSAFTDHPFAGHLGDNFYGAEEPSRKSMQMKSEKKSKRKSSFSNLLRPKSSSGDLSETMARESRSPSMLLPKHDSHDEERDSQLDEAEKSIAPDADEISGEEHEDQEEAHVSDAESESRESQFHPGFLAAPTTLLAELQMRKAQQRSRNRTAVDAFPNGMHSTLLELDTVTQLQQKARRQKHVKLAWEDKDAVDKENFDDDDVPLGVLFPEKEQQPHVNLNRPLGLMEKKEMEENEPLSHRRARLRGEPIQPPAPARSPGISQQGEEAPKPMLDLPKLEGSGADEEEEEEGETLGQRRQRMKNRKEHGLSGEFARQVSSELGLKVEGDHPSAPASKTPEIEETLGQRRRRLQAEAAEGAQHARPGLSTKRSMADLLQANPIGYIDHSEGKTAQLAMQSHEKAKEREAKYLAAQQADRYQAHISRTHFGQGHQGGLIQSSINGFQGYQQPYASVSASHVQGMYGGHNVHMTQGYSSVANLGVQPVHVNPTTGMQNMQMNYPYQYPAIQSYGYPPAMDVNAMEPPLDQKQRARIEGWRQGIM